MNKLEALFEQILEMPNTTGRRSIVRTKQLVRLYLDDGYSTDLVAYAKEVRDEAKIALKVKK